MKSHKILFVCLTFFSFVLSGCSQPQNSSSEYRRSQLDNAQETIVATVVSKRVVNVDGETGIGQAAGGLAGYITGNTVGDTDNENALGSIAGALLGATIGSSIESKVQSVQATEYILQIGSSDLITVLLTDGQFNVGDEVYVSMGAQVKILRKV